METTNPLLLMAIVRVEHIRKCLEGALEDLKCHTDRLSTHVAATGEYTLADLENMASLSHLAVNADIERAKLITALSVVKALKDAGIK